MDTFRLTMDEQAKLRRSAINEKVYRVVHLFDPKKGSRFHQMINQGLLNHPDVKFWASNHVVSFDRTLAYATGEQSLIQLMIEADLILFPGPEHYTFPQNLINAIERYRLWSKSVVYDFSDAEHINDSLLSRCRLYVKRTWEPGFLDSTGRQMLTVPYGALCEYIRPIDPEAERDIDIAFLMNPDPKSPIFQKSRLAANDKIRELATRPGFEGLNIVIGQEVHDGRRAILDRPDGADNPFQRYMDKLYRSKIIITVQPDHLGGDSRLWEALLSGAAVVSNGLGGQQLGLINDQHYMAFDPNGDIKELEVILLHLLSSAQKRTELAQAARDLVLQNHMPTDRITAILEKALGYGRK